MSWILNIDTAVQTASVCLAKDGQKIAININSSQADHAAWLQPAIAKMLNEHRVPITELSAIAVSAGPGSYTGLRVGMATAKGLCYALQKPLILINTLQMMAAGAVKEDASFLCPMIDARRMEVFTAVFNRSLEMLIAPHNHILSSDSFSELLSQGAVMFFGNGGDKFKDLVSHPNAIFKYLETTAEQMVALSYQSYQKQDFADLAYSQPLYTKEFFSPTFRKT